MKKMKVGQTLFLTPDKSMKIVEDTVVKVGSKYFYLKRYGKFSLSTLKNIDNYPYNKCYLSREEIEAKQERIRMYYLVKREFSVFPKRFSLKQLKAIYEIISEPVGNK